MTCATCFRDTWRRFIRRIKRSTFQIESPPLPLEDFKPAIFRAITAGKYGPYEAGRVVVEVCSCNRTLYVMDVVVAEEHRRQGIAGRLIEYAYEAVGAREIVPVTVDPESKEFWIALWRRSSLPVRMGLVTTELRATEHCLIRASIRPEK